MTIGPVIENGFYYDFYRDEPFTPTISPRSKDARIIARDRLHQEAARAEAHFAARGREAFKVELIDAISRDQAHQDLQNQGDWFDPAPRPAHDLDRGKIGNAFKLMKVAGAYWRGDSNNRCSPASTARPGPNEEELDAL